jgi:adenosyl cobinamide kinase/adenosyl cobinamide phosphate guanylyltransferase
VTLVVLLGGARSGKSARAVKMAEEAGAPVVFVATGEARDEEMAQRIDAHRQERPGAWTTVEEPLELRAAIAAAPPGSTVVVDCLSLWVANLLERGLEPDDLAPMLAAVRPSLTIVVSNEVGLGIVPANELARRFRDVLGRVNAAWVGASDEALLCVAGRTIAL